MGGAAVCASGAGTPACVAGILAAISSANHLSADAQKAVTGQEARTVLVSALVDRLDYTKEQAEKLQFYIDIGVIAVTVGAGGYKIAVDAKRLAKADQALVKLNTSAVNRVGPTATRTGRPIEFDGQFYSADGFKFSSSYYNRLWTTGGRPAPFLQARSVLESNPMITPDPRRAQGYFRYEGAGMEMIYNPTTGQVGHIQPLR